MFVGAILFGLINCILWKPTHRLVSVKISMPLFCYSPHIYVLYMSVKLLSFLSVSNCYNWVLTSFADQRLIHVIFEVLNFESIETVIFWNVTHCSLVPKYWHFRATCFLHLQYKRRQQVPLKHCYLFIYHIIDVTLFKMENLRFIQSSLTRGTLIFPNYFSVKYSKLN